MALPEVFLKRKARILNQLAVPDGEYDDLSPKGSIDEGIRELIEEINGVEGCVTTSSCAGRVAVFLEGRKVSSAQPQDGKGDDGKGDEEKGEGERERVSDYRDDRTVAKAGGKGGGGRWLFVSHDPVEKEEGNWSWAERFGMMRCEERDLMGKMKVEEVRFVHFKFEPMILHILTASAPTAQTLLTSALQSGFRESGALNLLPPSTSPHPPSPSSQATPIVAIRTTGLSLESIIGLERDGKQYCIVPEWQLQSLVEIANLRFVENRKRIGRLREELKRGFEKKGEGREWESTESRRERKKAEGLRAKECKLREKRGESGSERNEGGREEEDDGIGLDLMNDL